MKLASPPSRGLAKRRTGRLLACLAATALLAACVEEHTTAPSPGPLLSGHTIGPGSISVQVYEPGNPPTGVPNVTVAAVHNLLGPLENRGETNSSGQISFTNLPLGKYCVHVRPIFVNEATAGNEHFAPPSTGVAALKPAPRFGAAVTRRWNQSVALNVANYKAFCIDDGPIELTQQKPAADVVLRMTSPANLNVTWKGPDGQNVSAPAWVVVAFEEGFSAPWSPGLPPGARRGILLDVNDAGSPAHIVVPPGLQIAAEAGHSEFGPQSVILTGNAKKKAGSAGSTTNVEGQVTIATCQVTEDPRETVGDGHTVDFLPPVEYGFQAAPVGIGYVQTNAVKIRYEQTGNGSATLKLRDGTAQFQASYTCTGGSCSLTSQGGPAGLVAAVFAAPLGGTKARITWSVTGLSTENVTFRVETPGDQFPDASRNDEAWARVPVPTDCTGSSDTKYDILF